MVMFHSYVNLPEGKSYSKSIQNEPPKAAMGSHLWCCFAALPALAGATSRQAPTRDAFQVCFNWETNHQHLPSILPSILIFDWSKGFHGFQVPSNHRREPGETLGEPFFSANL